jgi:hypothetical protein
MIDGMHRVTVMRKLEQQWAKDSPGQQNPYQYFPRAIVYDYDELNRDHDLISFVADNANIGTECVVASTVMDRIDKMTPYHAWWVKHKLQKGAKPTLISFTTWFVTNVDDSITANSLRVYVSVCTRMAKQALQIVRKRFKCAKVSHVVLSRTHVRESERVSERERARERERERERNTERERNRERNTKRERGGGKREKKRERKISCDRDQEEKK